MARKLKEAAQPPAPYAQNRLGERIERLLQRAGVGIINAVRDTAVDVLSAGFELLLEVLERALAPRVGPIIDKVLGTEGLDPDVAAFLKKLKAPTSQADALGLTGIATNIGMGASSAVLAPVFRKINYAIDRSSQSARPDPAAAWAMSWRFPQNEKDFIGAMRDLGWGPEVIEVWREVLRPRLSPSDLIAHAYRTGGDPATHKPEIAKRGFGEGDIDRMIELSRSLPGPADLVRFAVREVFSPEQAAALSLFEEFPIQFGAEMQRQGFSEEYARWFWGAHWELPSLGYGFEMFHRLVDRSTDPSADNINVGGGKIMQNVIGRQTLESLMKALDIAPVWRDKLIQLSYSVPTRVDVRRAYRSGVIGLSEVYAVHRALGYDEKWAEILTKWTEAEYEPEERELVKSDVLKALKRSTVSADDATRMLTDLEYSQDAIAFYIAQAQYEREQDLADKAVAVVKKRFVSGLITELEATNQMNAYNVPPAEVALNLDQWKLDKEAKAKSPTTAQLSDFYRSGLIDVGALRQALLTDGYTEEGATLIIRNLDNEIAEAAAKEAARAAAEQERIAKAVRKTKYEQAASALDMRIAEQRLVIAAAQLALNAAMTEEQIRNAELQIDKHDAEIAAERVEIERQKGLRADAQAKLRARITDVERNQLESEIDKLDIQIADLDRQVRTAAVETEQLQLALFGIEDPAQIAATKERIQEIAVEVAKLKERQGVLKVQIEETRAALRAKITDAERQEWERAIADAEAGQRSGSAHIAELQALKEQKRLLVTREITSDDRAGLAESIDTARRRIAELQLEKAKLRTEV